MGKPVQWSPGATALPAASRLTALPATVPHPHPQATQRSPQLAPDGPVRVPCRLRHLQQRSLTPAPVLPSGPWWPLLPEIRIDHLVPTSPLSRSRAMTTPFGGFGLMVPIVTLRTFHEPAGIVDAVRPGTGRSRPEFIHRCFILAQVDRISKLAPLALSAVRGDRLGGAALRSLGFRLGPLARLAGRPRSSHGGFGLEWSCGCRSV